MKTQKSNQQLTEQEKQKEPLPGETSPENAFLKARQFAAQEKAKLKGKR